MTGECPDDLLTLRISETTSSSILFLIHLISSVGSLNEGGPVLSKLLFLRGTTFLPIWGLILVLFGRVFGQQRRL